MPFRVCALCLSDSGSMQRARRQPLNLQLRCLLSPNSTIPPFCHGRKPFHRRRVLSRFLQALRGVREEELVQYGMKKGHARFVVTSLAAGFGL